MSLSGVILLFALLYNACEDEPNCGCDGKKAFDVNDHQGTLYYELESDYAYFVSDVTYTKFIFCNPAEFSDTLATFEQGGRVFVSGTAHHECYRNPYAPPNYLLDLQSVRIYEVDD